MSVIVQKYGGSSVADTARIKKVAQLIKSRRDEGHRLCVVVSAMAHTTDELLAEAAAIHSDPPRRELDMLLSCGERASVALLAMALDAIDVPCISFTGSQSGIITNDAHAGARILEVRPYRVQDELEKDRVVIVAGFQGVSYRREITTLGRGGSDTTAVALAAALDAEACEIYSDVDGVYSADPRIVEDAHKLAQLSPDQMLVLAQGGAKVLAPTAVAYAREKGVALYAKKTGSADPGTVVRRDLDGANQVVPVAHKSHWRRVTVKGIGATLRLRHALATTGMPVAFTLAQPQANTLLIAPEDAHGLADVAAAHDAQVTGDWGSVTLVDALSDAQRDVLDATLADAELLGVLAAGDALTLFVQPDQVAFWVKRLHAALNP